MGWIFDDNNGWYASGSGTGIALGCLRFSYDPQWACVPFGTLIVVYNEHEKDPLIPADDLTDANGDDVFILPGNSTFFERNNSIPNTSNGSYVGLTFNSPPLWFSAIMRNGGDSFQTIDPNDLTSAFHAFSWGNNDSFPQVYFNSSFSGMVAIFHHAVSNDLRNNLNWSLIPIAGFQTPGAANNFNNQVWINSMKGVFTGSTWTWNGSVNNNWFEPCNWDRFSVPQLTSDVVIPGNTTHQPMIQTDSAFCKSLTNYVVNNGHLTIDWLSGGVLIKQP